MMKWKVVEEFTKDNKVNKPISEEESLKFLKLMKHTKHSIIEQLKKTSTQISLLLSILSSKLYKKTL
jgi:hypothetical protein